jgi:hypothetical protein
MWLLAVVLVANAPLPAAFVQIFEEERDGQEDAKKDLEELLQKGEEEQEPPHQLAHSYDIERDTHVHECMWRPVDAPSHDPSLLSVRRLL